MSAPETDFKSPEELQRVLDHLAGRLHYVNRVSGERNFTWHLANLIRAVGALAPLMRDDPVNAEFGDGWTAGTLDAAAQSERMFALLRERLR